MKNKLFKVESSRKEGKEKKISPDAFDLQEKKKDKNLGEENDFFEGQNSHIKKMRNKLIFLSFLLAPVKSRKKSFYMSLGNNKSVLGHRPSMQMSLKIKNSFLINFFKNLNTANNENKKIDIGFLEF